MESKLPIYAGIHKGQRRWLTEMLVRREGPISPTGRRWSGWWSSWNCSLSITRSMPSWRNVSSIRTSRSSSQEGRKEIEDEHIAHHELLLSLIGSLNSIKEMRSDHPSLPQIGQDFYLAWCRFVAEYLMHIDYEESYLQNVLLNDSTAEEIMTIFVQILDGQPPSSLRSNLLLMLTAMNIPEAVGLLNMAGQRLPQKDLEDLEAQAAKLVHPAMWAAIQAKMAQR